MNNAVGGGFCGVQSDGSFVIGSATAFKTGGGSWTATSDARIKNVVYEYELGLEEVLQLRPIVYSYKGNDDQPDGPSLRSDPPDKLFVGLVAQEVESIFPNMVAEREGYIDGEKVSDLRTLDVSELLYAFVNAFKEMKREIDGLKAHVQRL